MAHNEYNRNITDTATHDRNLSRNPNRLHARLKNIPDPLFEEYDRHLTPSFFTPQQQQQKLNFNDILHGLPGNSLQKLTPDIGFGDGMGDLNFGTMRKEVDHQQPPSRLNGPEEGMKIGESHAIEFEVQSGQENTLNVDEFDEARDIFTPQAKENPPSNDSTKNYELETALKPDQDMKSSSSDDLDHAAILSDIKKSRQKSNRGELVKRINCDTGRLGQKELHQETILIEDPSGSRLL